MEPPEVRAQREKFNKAMELFHGRDFRKAFDAFEQAAAGPLREISFAARTHQRMCEQRLEKQTVRLETPEDYYNYGVALTNERNLEAARANLEKAVSLREADHYEYALAACLALMGAYAASADHLSKAISLDPRNRIAARNDADFSDALKRPEFQAIAQREPSA